MKLHARMPIKLMTLAMTIAGLTLSAHAQDRGEVEAEYDGNKVAVEYGRPALKGRDMLGRASEGMVWRFGMNQATTLSTEADLSFGDVKVAKGTYSILAKKVAEDKWHLIFNEKSDLWGTSRDEAQDLPEIPFTVGKTDELVEVFTIELHGSGSEGTMKAMWGNISLSVDFEVH